MTRRCELTGTLPLSGQLRSHAENKTKRKFRPNIHTLTAVVDGSLRRVKASTKAIRMGLVVKPSTLALREIAAGKCRVKNNK